MPQNRPDPNPLDPALSQEILRAVAGVNFGSVEITIHQKKVVSIEIRERRRLEPQRREPESD
jgi:hypothetical protein